MPRKGSGQKIQTAKGQAYGEAQAQEEAQRQMPLPQMPSAAKASPGQSSLNRSTERPNEALAAAAGPPPQRTFEGVNNETLAAQLPILESIASQPNATAQTKAFVRQLRMVAQRNGAMQ
tara:strand:+ start:443 stop:799 length:357 start_codon:yes stop_codon:yes gene_type:complete